VARPQRPRLGIKKEGAGDGGGVRPKKEMIWTENIWRRHPPRSVEERAEEAVEEWGQEGEKGGGGGRGEEGVEEEENIWTAKIGRRHPRSAEEIQTGQMEEGVEANGAGQGVAERWACGHRCVPVFISQNVLMN